MGRVRRPARAEIIEALELSYTLLQEMPEHAAQGKTIAKLLAEVRSAIAIARGFVAPQGYDLSCVPAFTEQIIDGKERSGIKLIVKVG